MTLECSYYYKINSQQTSFYMKLYFWYNNTKKFNCSFVHSFLLYYLRQEVSLMQCTAQWNFLCCVFKFFLSLLCKKKNCCLVNDQGTTQHHTACVCASLLNVSKISKKILALYAVRGRFCSEFKRKIRWMFLPWMPLNMLVVCVRACLFYMCCFVTAY